MIYISGSTAASWWIIFVVTITDGEQNEGLILKNKQTNTDIHSHTILALDIIEFIHS